VKTQYILRVFSNTLGEIEQSDVKQLLADADRFGCDTAPLTLIKPTNNPEEDKRWGLEIEIHGE
jgi:hypothetical protein